VRKEPDEQVRGPRATWRRVWRPRRLPPGTPSIHGRRPSARFGVVRPRHVGCNRPAQRSGETMRADELVVLTKAEYEELKAQAGSAAGDAGELFNSEEMQAIRDQYEERIIVEQEKREELEWKLRMELAKIRDAELASRRAADEMRRIEATLQALLTDEDIT